MFKRKKGLGLIGSIILTFFGLEKEPSNCRCNQA